MTTPTGSDSTLSSTPGVRSSISDGTVGANHSPAGIGSTRRQFSHHEFPVSTLLALKGHTTVSVVLPARNEAATVGAIVANIHAELVQSGVVDELVVIDDHSADDTAAVAEAAGATVVAASEVLASFGRGHGKGEVLWKSLAVTTGEIVLWCDADIKEFDSRFLRGLLGPMLADPTIYFTKGFYRREERDGVGGGRVTELAARPLLSMYFPALTDIHQPLSGEYGGRRTHLEQVPFVGGYGVDVGLLISLSQRFGIEGIAQIDLEVRHHRNRPLTELAPQAAAVAQTIVQMTPSASAPQQFTITPAGAEPSNIQYLLRPPMAEVRESLAFEAEFGGDPIPLVAVPAT